MKRIIFCGWKPGLKAVSLTLFFRHKIGYSLTQAKATTDAVIARKRVEIELPQDGIETMLAELTDIGVEFMVSDEPQQHAT